MKEIEKNLGTNIRRLRIRDGLTQTRLGELLGFSEKAVSKWERGACLPSLATLVEIASFFKVKTDDLIREEKLCFLGIDGGGTMTHLVLTDAEMNVIKEIRTDACNPIDVGIDRCKEILKEAIYTVSEGFSFSSIVMFAGISGGTSHDVKCRLKSFFESFGFLAFDNGNDLENIMAAGLEDGDGIAVIMGTGFCIFSSKGGSIKRIGGWGYFFDDGGSSFNIARDGIAAHLRAIDGIGEQTLISSLIERSCPDPQKLIGKLYAEGKRGVAELAPLILEAAEQKDRIAIEITERNIKYCADAIRYAAQEFDKSVPIVIAGGLTIEPLVPALLERELEKDKINIKILTRPPVYGALVCARAIAERTCGF